jgi:hypothetical protein
MDIISPRAVLSTGLDIGKQPLQRRAVHVGAGIAAVVVLLRQRHPAFLPLAVDE